MLWSKLNPCGMDFETSGRLPEYALQPWRIKRGDAWATSLVWIHDGQVYGGLSPTRATMERMLKDAIEFNRTIVGWNTLFDLSILFAYGLDDLILKCRWLDAMLIWKHLEVEPEYDLSREEKQHWKLKECVAKLWPDEAGYEEGIEFHEDTPEAREKLHAYNIRDVGFTLRAGAHHWQKLTDVQQRVVLLESACLPLVAQANTEGMLVDTLATHELQSELIMVAEDRAARLEMFGCTETIVRSSVKLAKLLFDDWGLPVIKENPRNTKGEVTRSTDKEVLHELFLTGDGRAKLLREYREALGNRTKFADAPLKSVAYNEDGRTHPTAFVFSTYSGRMTYASTQGKNKDKRQTGFPLHQEKKGKNFRSIIIPPPGYELVEFDADGQEFKWMAVACGDETMLQLCLPGEDAHSFLGSRITRVDYRELIRLYKQGDADGELKRRMGKVGNLCLARGTPVLTDRGYCAIQDVRREDRLWDGVEWVTHGGVVFQGWKETIGYAGIRATPDHRVLVGGRWETLADAARHGWVIEPALGEGWSRRCRSAVRILGGCVRRIFVEVGRALRDVSLSRLRADQGGQPIDDGGRSIEAVQGLRHEISARPGWPSVVQDAAGSSNPEASQRVVSAVQQPERQELRKLRWPGNTLRFRIGEGWRRVCARAFTARDLLETRYRSYRQRWPLCSGQSSPSDARDQHVQSQTNAVYDILDAGPRLRFVAAGLIVHNSLQYRTSAPRLMSTARVDYNIPMTIDEASLVHATYRTTYPGVPIYWRHQIDRTKRQGYVETLAGRRVRVVGDWNGNKGWSMGSTAINYRIQGTGAEQKYLALAVLKPYMVEHGIRFAWDLHDGIYFYVPTEKVKTTFPVMNEMLNNLPYEKAWGLKLPIKMTWSGKVGPSWGELKEMKL